MKIQILSDMHLEFSGYTPAASIVDLVILAGDISTGHAGIHWAAKHFEDVPVLYVPGNHEFYHTSIEDWLAEAARLEAVFPNIHLGHRKALNFKSSDGQRVRVLGATLWTNFSLFGPDSREYSGHQAQSNMSDFQVIKYKERPLKWEDTLEFHRQDLSWLKSQIEAGVHSGERIVVATHHGPSTACKHPKYINSPLTPAFTSNLDNYLLDQPIDAWIFGHTHHNIDVDLNGTRLLANQRGYRTPGRPPEIENFDSALYIEL